MGYSSTKMAHVVFKLTEGYYAVAYTDNTTLFNINFMVNDLYNSINYQCYNYTIITSTDRSIYCNIMRLNQSAFAMLCFFSSVLA